MSVGGGVDIIGGGRAIGGASDQFHFAWQPQTGDFDRQTRLAGLTVPDPFLHAGLMARESLQANARFAAVFASSPQLGCFFQWRSSTGAASSTATVRGSFPVNDPHTWLRLQRLGTTFTSYASLDGLTWTQLGTASIAGLPSTIYLGFAVSGDNEKAVAAAQFRDIGPTQSKTTGTARITKEAVGPCSRTTGMILSEIHYHPPPRQDGRNLEFIEVHNARSLFEDLTGWRLSGDIEYRFPDGLSLAAGETRVIAAAPDDVRTVYGITNVLGPYTNSLPNDLGHVQLRNGANAVRLDVEYSDTAPWPVSADGAGHSLVLARPSYGEADPRAWAASESRGGSPGSLDPTVPTPETAVVINEFLAHTDDPVRDFIELYNHSNAAVNLSGCVLTDDPATNRFRVPDGTWIQPRAFLSWDQVDLGFELSAAGATIFLINATGTRVLDAARFGGQDSGISTGRSPDGSAALRRLAQSTPGSPNTPWREETVVINEIMYHPISHEAQDEYVELLNRSGQAIDLHGWRLDGGIQFTFPAQATLPKGGYLVLAKNAARLIAIYPQLNTHNTLGNYDGSLRDSGDRIVLTKPGLLITTNAFGLTETNRIALAVSEVAFADGGRWGTLSDGGGSSLELIDPRADPLRPSNWADSDETTKASWTSFSFTGRVDLANGTANRLHLGMLGAGECLVDDLEVLGVAGTNVATYGSLESGTTGWVLSGNHSRSTVDATGAASGSRCLHVRGLGDGDTGPNTLRTTLRTPLSASKDATLRAKVRWLAGWPEILLRVHGNGLDYPIRMAVPANLGTPGQPNSRRVSNAGPAIHEVTHSPPLPAAQEQVRVTCQVSDPDRVVQVRLQYRIDPATTLSSLAMLDSGTAGDEIAGDGVYSALLPGQTTGRLVAFRITATDGASTAATALFPAKAPEEECLVRWGDPVPLGTFAHYHLWFTQATANARQNALDNTYRDCTLVYGGRRVIYNTGFRDKGSPYHGGAGDIAAATPADAPLLGTQERIFASTGNGGSESTAIRSQLAAWYAQQLGLPYLHAHYMLLFFNGSLFREVMEDLEQPSHSYAERWFTSAAEGDLYKIAVWFEFQDDNRNFAGTSATLSRFVTTPTNTFKTARYRWNFQRRSNHGNASKYEPLFDLAAAANDTSAAYVNNLLNLADLEQWMRAFCFDFAMGNWDAWTYNVGQNMYLYKPDGQRWVLMPWDVDFTFGQGDGTSGALRSGQDSTMNRAYVNPTFLRMNWRAYQDTVAGPFLAAKFQPQIDARRSVLVKNNITSLQTPTAITTWINARRAYLQTQLANADSKTFTITSNGGADFTSTTPTVTLDGTAPFAVASIEVNGVPVPVTWTTARTFRLAFPLTQPTNALVLTGKDLRGHPVPGAADQITVQYAGAIEQVQDFVGLNELLYDSPPNQPGTAFMELFNRSATTPFDLGGLELRGVGYSFPSGSFIQPGKYLLVVADRFAFGNAFGGTLPVFDVFPGALDNDGESVALVRPAATPDQPDTVLSDVRYLPRPPWPSQAAGFGPSLQRIDPVQDGYRVANWTATAPDDANRATPGRSNSVAQSLEPFPPLWLNEVQPNNVNGATDNVGDHDPWIELYNAGTNTVDLTPFALTHVYSLPTLWPFPPGTTLEPGQFLLVWADAEPSESETNALHASFRLEPTTGTVALTRQQGAPATSAVLDFIEYDQLSPERSVGSYPDGEPRRRRRFTEVTPGTTNNPALPPIEVRLNEFMAGNTHTLADPVDGDSEDWFELYNAGSSAVDLATYTLTDDLTEPDKYVIPAGTVIPAGGYLLVWADEETGQNAAGQDLHADFRLAASGEDLGLFAPDGSLVDGFTFGTQTNDVSMGRYPDAADLPLYGMVQPSPRTPNLLAGANRPPVFAPLPDPLATEGDPITFTVSATDPDPGQTLRYALGADAPPAATLDERTGAFSWTPAEADGPGRASFLIRATDDGTPVRTATLRATVVVQEVNQPPTLLPIDSPVAEEGTLLAIQFAATDPDRPANQLRFTLDPGAPAGADLAQDGAFTWTPDESFGGTQVALTVRVTDNGSPPRTDTATFVIRVAEVAAPPDMPLISPQQADEETTFRFQVVATNPDAPLSPLFFELEAAPAGAWIDPHLGEITWWPPEEIGPATVLFVVRAWTTRPPFLSSARTFSLTVNEVNRPPVLFPIGDQGVLEGHTLAFQTQAIDPDLPSPALAFALASGAPAGMTIAPDSGWIVYTPDPDLGPATHDITVRVSDDHPSPVSDTRAFRVIVSAQSHAVINEILYRPTAHASEFIELLNNSAHTPASLGGCQLVGANLAFSFAPETTLAPGQFLLVVQNQSAFETAFGGDLPIAGEWTGSIIPGGDTLRLVRSQPDGTIDVLDEVAFSATAPWPASANSAGSSLQLRDPLQDNTRVANWGAVAGLGSATPGAANSVAASLPPFPAVFINEVLANNTTGLLDNAGEREPWIELHNAGPVPLSLGGWCLTDSFDALTRWAFPSGFVVNPGEFRLLCADGEPAETDEHDVHIGFRLQPGGDLALVRFHNAAPVIVDWLTFPILGPDVAFGSMPDGQNSAHQILEEPTPGGSNRSLPTPRIGTIELTPEGSVSFEWESVPGLRYRIEAASPITPGTWARLFDAVAQTAVMSYTDLRAAESLARFYRVVIVP